MQEKVEVCLSIGYDNKEMIAVSMLSILQDDNSTSENDKGSLLSSLEKLHAKYLENTRNERPVIYLKINGIEFPLRKPTKINSNNIIHVDKDHFTEPTKSDVIWRAFIKQARDALLCN